jgi:hypothetical protein
MQAERDANALRMKQQLEAQKAQMNGARDNQRAQLLRSLLSYGGDTARGFL